MKPPLTHFIFPAALTMGAFVAPQVQRMPLGGFGSKGDVGGPTNLGLLYL